MKVAYIGKIQLSDVDLSYLHEAQKLSDVSYFMEVNPRFHRGPGFMFPEVAKKNGIFKAIDIYPGLAKYSKFIDIDKFYIVNTSGRLWAIKALFVNIMLMLRLMKGNFNVVHVAWPLNVYEFALYALYKKMMLTVHDPFPHSGLDTFIVRLRRKVAFALIPKLILLNKQQKNEFMQYYHIPSKRIVESQLSCYTYLRTVSEFPMTDASTNNFILFAGKISRYKGLDYLLPAMREVHKVFPKTKLIVAGGGSFHFDVTEYEKLEYIDIRNRFIPEEELVSLIKHSRFVVCPYTDATQSGVVMSAFAFAKPVVVTNVGGLPCMVGHGAFGDIVKEKDIEALTQSIIKLLSHPELLQEYSNNIFTSYEKGERSWRHIADALKKIYNSL